MSGLFGGGSQPAPPAPPPAPTPPPPMPDPYGPSAVAAQRKAMSQAVGAGRSATTLTTAGNAAGGTLAGGFAGTKTGG